MSSVINTVKKNLKLRIEALSSVQVVYGYEKINPDGWPAVWVLPANLDGEFTSTAENRRAYGFDVTVLFPIGQDAPQTEIGEREEYAQERVAETMEEIINDMDENFELPGDNNVLWISASDAEWGTVDYEGGKAKAVQITLVVNIDHQVTS